MQRSIDVQARSVGGIILKYNIFSITYFEQSYYMSQGLIIPLLKIRISNYSGHEFLNISISSDLHDSIQMQC